MHSKFVFECFNKGMNYRQIQKEEIRYLHFPFREILDDEVEKNKRKSDLYRAMILGNGSRCKVKIVFEADLSLNYVETTVWCATEKDVNLKSGINLPVHCIKEVIF